MYIELSTTQKACILYELRNQFKEETDLKILEKAFKEGTKDRLLLIKVLYQIRGNYLKDNVAVVDEFLKTK